MQKSWLLYRWKKYMWVIHDAERGHGDARPQDPWMPSFYPILDAAAPRGSAAHVTFADADFPGRSLILTKSSEPRPGIMEYHDQDANVLWILAHELDEYFRACPERIFIGIK